MKVKDCFAIRAEYQTGHAPGLVVVLDAPAGPDPKALVGQVATVRAPSGKVSRLPVDEAKEHGPVSSLFFRDVPPEDVPIGSEISIAPERPPGSDGPAPAPSPVSGGLTR